MLSAKYGHARVVKQLLDAGADPLARNQFSASALHWVRLDSSLVLGGAFTVVLGESLKWIDYT